MVIHSSGKSSQLPMGFDPQNSGEGSSSGVQKKSTHKSQAFRFGPEGKVIPPALMRMTFQCRRPTPEVMVTCKWTNLVNKRNISPHQKIHMYAIQKGIVLNLAVLNYDSSKNY
jgi:hypothetical protein